ncbi:MAG: response regulator [Phenylobacterium sp.]|uniref:response regulator n=1 Tax=Phenylobacterium sp. TaxID=1871053 RepID=UPI00391C2CA7
MLEPTADTSLSDGYIRYSRTVALTRLLLVGGFVALLALYTPWTMAALGVLEFGLYFLLLLATEAAMRASDRNRAFRTLRWRSDVLMFLLVANACWLAVQIRLYGEPLMQVEAALLAICVLLFAALRVHVSRLSYVIGVAPPAATLLWIAIDPEVPLPGNHYALAMLLFVAAVLTVTWRQQATDRALARALRRLASQNAELLHARDEAQAASRARTRLLAVASHEIRTPLNALLGFAQVLRREPLDARQAELVGDMVEGGEQLARLLDGVLDLTEPDMATGAPRSAPFDLRRRLEATVRIWRAEAAKAGVDLVFEDLEPDLAYGMTADAAKLEQAVASLLSQALKVTPAGGRVALRLAGRREADEIAARVEVQDGGPPIPAQEQPLTLEAFDRTGRGRLAGGSALSLAASAHNLAALGGETGVEPAADGNGAVFWFAFRAPAHEAQAQEAAPVPTRRLRVLAAEDNAANRRVLAALLEPIPVDLAFAEDGMLALEAWRGGGFHLVLMDANMPRMDGVEALRAIRAAEGEGARTPIWMLTANVFEDDVARYSAAGADGVLRKPIDAAALIALLGEIADRVD